MRFLCRVGYHKWGQWKTVVRDYAIMDAFFYTKTKFKQIETQETNCVHCNKKKIKI